jgi:SAM-dependent methyltransferase
MIKNFRRNFAKFLRKLRRSEVRHKAARILASSGEPYFNRAEDDFPHLQERYQPRAEYGYDPFSIFERASDRAVRVLQLPGLNRPGLKGLDIGTGDGMLAVLLDRFGHSMSVNDVVDWRTGAAKELRMLSCDCSEYLPLERETLDFVVSFNTLEHLKNPGRAMNEIIRVMRPGGLIYLDFGPLFCGPWGLHAYRTLRMPYPQFLFSEVFIEETLRELGAWDLGVKRTELQHLNRWRPNQFAALWQRPEIDVVASDWRVDDAHVNIIREYPECFRGRGLTLQDVILGSVMVILKKKEK